MPQVHMLTGRRVVAAKVEATEGTAETLAAADAKFRVRAPRWRNAPAMTPRNTARQSFAMLPDVVGGSILELSAGIELAGHTTSLTTPPNWNALFRGCCLFHHASIFTVTPGAVTPGASLSFDGLIHGEVVSQATSNARGLVVGDYYDGVETSLRIIPLTSAAFDAVNVCTGSISGSTFTPSAVGGASIGQAWWPMTFPVYELTFASITNPPHAIGDVVKQPSVGTVTARGVVVMASADTTGFTKIFVRPIHGVFTSGTAVGNETTGQAIGTPSAVTLHGPSLTAALYADGVVYKGRGMRGTLDIPFVVNDLVAPQVSLRGILESISEAANLTVGDNANPYEAKIPPVFLGSALVARQRAGGASAFSIATLRTNRIDVAIGNEYPVRGSVTDSSGYEPAQLVGRNSSLSLTVDAWDKDEASNSAFDPHAFFTAGTPFRLSWQVGSQSGNRFECQVPSALVRSMGDSDRDGVASYDVSCMIGGGPFGTGGTLEGRDNEFIVLLT